MIVELARQIERYAGASTTLLNYANPMAMNTWAALDASPVNTIGLCHGVQGGHRLLAHLFERRVNDGRTPDEPGYRRVTKADVDIVAAGINHQTWYLKVLFDGRDWARDLLELFEADEQIRDREKVRMDIIRRFGYFSTESNGHLSEYLPWYRKRPDEIPAWISTDAWIHGETAGYLRACTENRNWFETEYAKHLEAEPASFDPARRSDEHGSWIIEAMETGRVYRGHFNVKNRDVISNLPADAIVEVPGYVDRNGLAIPVVGDLPLGAAAICSNSIQVQRMATPGCHDRGRATPEAGHPAGPARGCRLQPPGGVADGRRDASRAGRMAAPVRERDRGGPGAPRHRTIAGAPRERRCCPPEDTHRGGNAGGSKRVDRCGDRPTAVAQNPTTL